MTKTFDSVTGFFNKQGVDLTIVEMEAEKDVFTISFEAPSLRTMKDLSGFIRKEETDTFLLANISLVDGVFTATVIAKKLFETIVKTSRHIGSVFDEMITDYSPVLLDEDAVQIFEEGIGEMFAVADAAEDLSYQIIAPKHDTLLKVTEFCEATSHLFTLYRGMLCKKSHHYYNELIHTLDRLEG